MEAEELKRKLMGLWEKTSHNSKDLLVTLFDFYFDEKYMDYKEVDGKIVSAILGIPYSFGFGDKHLQGLYLISLSSEEGFRKKGDLAELINIVNTRFKNDFDFTFLIPHTELLADYFGTQHYLNSFFILEERFTPLHDFRNDYLLSLNDTDDKIRLLKKDLMDQIKVIRYQTDGKFSSTQVIEFLEYQEKKGSASVNMVHTDKDWRYLMLEKNFAGIATFISYDADEKITGIGFVQKDDIKRVKVIAHYMTDMCSFYSLLDYIRRQYDDHSISVVTSDPKYQTLSIIQQNYAASNPAGGDLDNTFDSIDIPLNTNRLLLPMGMVRFLRFEGVIKYIAETRSDIDFKLYLRDYKITDESSQEEKIFIVKNGHYKIESLANFKKDPSLLNLSCKEFSELLLRKNDSSNLIMEAFGIPRLNLQIRLLPC